MKRLPLYVTTISVLISFLVLGCGGANTGGDTSQGNAEYNEDTPPKEMAEYNYYMEQAGLAQAEQRLDDALEYYQEASAVLESTGNASIKLADAHYETAQIAYQRYKKELAIEEYEKAAEIYLRFSGNAKTKAAVVYTNMGVVWKELHNKGKARSCWQYALELYGDASADNQNKGHIEKIQQNIRDLDEGF